MTFRKVYYLFCSRSFAEWRNRLMVFGSHRYRVSRLFSTASKTSLYDVHLKYGGKMVDFSGWSLPVQYGSVGIIESCLHTRSKASLFDVSHMGQLLIHGKDREAFIESLTVSDMKGLDLNESCLTVFTTEAGGIIDDALVTKKSDSVLVVLNAGCVEKDVRHLEEAKESFKGEVEITLMREHSLIALQGPEAAKALQPLVERIDLSRLSFMSAINAQIAGIQDCCVSRSGCTGEDGFEISIPNDASAVHIVETLLSDNTVRLAGLGARDTLRIEAGLCLYGSDIDESISPIEAGLGWTISKRRRAEMNFPGANAILEQIQKGVRSKRVGLTILEGPPARHGNRIFSTSDLSHPVGRTTSGTYSPSLGQSIAIGYVDAPHATAGTDLQVEVRGKLHPVQVTKMPFVKPNYYRVRE